MKIKAKLAALLVSLSMLTGLGLIAAAPAQAAVSASSQHCNWPQRATVKFTTWSKGQVSVYSPGGAWLGSRALNVPGTTTYNTPWEDISFYFSGQIASWSSWCR